MFHTGHFDSLGLDRPFKSGIGPLWPLDWKCPDAGVGLTRAQPSLAVFRGVLDKIPNATLVFVVKRGQRRRMAFCSWRGRLC